MALIKKFTPQNGDKFIGVDQGDHTLAKFGHLNYLLRQINSSLLNFTPGSVLFSDSNGDPAGDPTQFYWDDVNNRLGVGTNTPSVGLDAFGGVDVASINGPIPSTYRGVAPLQKLPQLVIEAATRNDSAVDRHYIRAGGWHTSTWFGAEACNSWQYTGGADSTQNDAFGYRALFSSTTGNNNQAFGGWALFALTTGVQNCAFGLDSLWKTTTGIGNAGYGYFSGESLTTGSYNTFIGQRAGRGITTGSSNTVIGAQVQGLSATLSNHIIIADGSNNRRIVSFNDGNTFIGGSTALPTNNGFKLQVAGTGYFEGSPAAFDYTKSVLTIKNMNTAPQNTYGLITLDNNDSSTQSYADIRLGDNPTAIRFYATSLIAAVATGAAFQAFRNTDTNFPGQMYFDSGSTNNAAIIFRTAPSLVASTERMRIKSNGSVRFQPMTQPVTAEAGDVYYDSGTNKLRCYNGSIWNDLF
jgi:hypothetical protein